MGIRTDTQINGTESTVQTFMSNDFQKQCQVNSIREILVFSTTGAGKLETHMRKNEVGPWYLVPNIKIS